MATTTQIRSALVSVFSKEGLEPIIRKLHELGVTLYSTGGTQKFMEGLNVPVTAVESLTSYPSILDGRVKTLHPKVFGGILARREQDHLDQLDQYEIPAIDLVIVDLYPFEETVANTDDESQIIEKIDIGGISLIRAAAKNFKDVVVVPSRQEYDYLLELLESKNGRTDLEDRKHLARKAFAVSSHYDTAIFNYFNESREENVFKQSIHQSRSLRYGENPHQPGAFFGPLEDILHQIHGKELSYNNLVDIDAAISLMAELKDGDPAFAILKHTNACGVAVRGSLNHAWRAALEADNVSAFGGILICNREIDLPTAEEVNKIFYEVLIAPAYSEEALELLTKKKKRILLQIKDWSVAKRSFRRLLNGVIQQDTDLKVETAADLNPVTKKKPDDSLTADLLFGNICVKHLKSNAIALVKNQQLIGMGCGQTSRIDALKQAVEKAKRFGLDLNGAVLASDAFFPFSDSVELAHQEGIQAVIQPGGSIRDQESIDFCDASGMAMVFTGTRHFKH